MTTLELSPRIAARIRRKLRNGAYADADSVVAEALRLLDERDKLEKRDVALGFEQLRKGAISKRSMEDIIALANKRHARKSQPKG